MDEKEEAQKQEAQGAGAQTPPSTESQASQAPGVPEGATSNSSRTEAGNLIELSNKAAERSEKAAALLKAENDRAEQIAIKNQLSGRGQAVPPQKPVNPEEVAAKARVRAIGKATGAKWADDIDSKKPMDSKSDGP